MLKWPENIYPADLNLIINLQHTYLNSMYNVYLWYIETDCTFKVSRLLHHRTRRRPFKLAKCISKNCKPNTRRKLSMSNSGKKAIISITLPVVKYTLVLSQALCYRTTLIIALPPGKIMCSLIVIDSSIEWLLSIMLEQTMGYPDTFSAIFCTWKASRLD